MRRATRRPHIEFDALDPIIRDHAHADTPVRAHWNPLRHGIALVTARDERHAVRRELHELERRADLDDDAPATTT